MNISKTLSKKNLKTSFVDERKSSAKGAFYKYLGADEMWFADVLYNIKEEWIENEYNITDILIRENAPILLAIVKAHVPYVVRKKNEHDKDMVETPRYTKNQIIDVVKKFTTISDEPDGVSEDFSFFVMGLGIFRANFSIDSSGCGLSLRYLTFVVPSFESMGYPKFYRRAIESLVEHVNISVPGGHEITTGVVKQGGLILHVGPTASGKTTSIASEIDFFSQNTSGTIVTYEQPVEYKFISTKAPVRQYELGEDIKATEDDTLLDVVKRHLLRNNPSIALIGEGRTKEEIRMMLETGLKGHLVLGTIHASNVIEGITTLASVVKGEEYILANSIRAIVAHRLHVRNDGSIIPLYEIFIPSEQDRYALEMGEISKVKSAILGQNVNHQSCMTFGQHVEQLMHEGKLSAKDGKTLLQSVIRKVQKQGE